MADRSLFKHEVSLRVRSIEVDWQGIVHNANYLLYFEDGRVSYLEFLGVKLDVNSLSHDFKVVVARNEIDYHQPARLGDGLVVLTRISYIKTTSFAFEGRIQRADNGLLLAENVSIHVFIDSLSGNPMPVPDEFRRKVQSFEGDSCTIHRSIIET